MKTLYFLMFIIIAGACGKKALDQKELLNYALEPENGLIKRVEKANTVLEMYYKPKALIVEQESRGITDPAALRSITERFDSMDYFVLRLARGGKEIETSYASNPASFNETINYLSYYMAEDVKLIHDRDTLSPLDLAYARSFGTANATSVMLVFRSGLNTSDGRARVIFDDQKLGTGTNEFDFNTSDIKNIPPLKNN